MGRAAMRFLWVCLLVGFMAVPAHALSKGFYARGWYYQLYHFENPSELPPQGPGSGFTMDSMYDFDFAPDGCLYGFTFEESEPIQLVRIDPVQETIDVLGVPGTHMTLAIDSTGRAVSFDSTGFVQINLSDATTTTLHPSSSTSIVVTGLAFDHQDRLFALDRDGICYRLDSFTGEVLESTQLTGLDPDWYSYGLTFDENDHAFFYHFRSSSDRRLYGAALDGTPCVDYSAIDIPPRSFALAYYVPEPATMGLLALGGLALLRRRSAN